jgi:RNase H-like domain found in reverse transcriptase
MSLGESQREAVALLRHLISTAPCLRYFSSDLPTKVFTDASDYAIGGWIAQEHADGWHPCTFWSRKLTPTELSYSTHEKELLALVAMVTKYNYWLLGVKFVCLTDHEALKYLQEQPHLTRRQARWVITLQEFDTMIVYIKGEENNVADLLSRSALVAPRCDTCNSALHIKRSVNSVQTERNSHNTGTFRQRVIEGYAKDELAQSMF